MEQPKLSNKLLVKLTGTWIQWNMIRSRVYVKTVKHKSHLYNIWHSLKERKVNNKKILKLYLHKAILESYTRPNNKITGWGRILVGAKNMLFDVCYVNMNI